MMATVANYPHISFGPDDRARIGQTRYKVSHLAAEHYHYGWSAEELLRQHPDLRPEEIYATLTYFYDHYDVSPNILIQARYGGITKFTICTDIVNCGQSRRLSPAAV